MTDDEVPATGGDNDDDDVIESAAPSTRSSALQRRLDRVIPPTVSRSWLGGTAISALAIGLIVGLLVAESPPPQVVAEPVPAEQQSSSAPAGGYIPIVPYSSLDEEAILALSIGSGYLSQGDLAAIGETALLGTIAMGPTYAASRLCGIPDNEESLPSPPVVTTADVLSSSAQFLIAGATLIEWISPYLGSLSSATLQDRVELATNCDGTAEGLTVTTAGSQADIGDEFALFVVQRPDLDTGVVMTSYLVLVRVGGQLVELSMTPVGDAEIADAEERILAIAQAAVTRMLA